MVRTLTLEPQTPDLFVSNCEYVDHRTRHMRSITMRAESAGHKSLQTTTERHGRSWTNGQLVHRWKVLPARAEIAIRRVKWQAMTEHNHAHLQTKAAIWETAPRRAIRRFLSTHGEFCRSGLLRRFTLVRWTVRHGRFLRTSGGNALFGGVQWDTLTERTTF